MKSYFLSGIQNEDVARLKLSEILAGQGDPWNLRSEEGDAIAYFNIAVEEGTLEIHADISGRHYDEHTKVIAVLRALQTTLGGTILNDFEKIV